MRQNTVLLLGLALLSAGLVSGCGGSGTEDDRVGESTLVGRCSGDYSCDFDGEIVETEFAKVGAACYLGQVELFPDGTGVAPDGRAYQWVGDVDEFDLCFEGYCVSCQSDDAATDGECQGNATSCSSMSTSRCSMQRGCYYNVGSTLSESDDSCRGSSRSCSSFHGPTSCHGQDGCSWR